MFVKRVFLTPYDGDSSIAWIPFLRPSHRFPRSAEEAKLLFMEPPAPEEDEEGEPGEPTLRATAPLLAVRPSLAGVYREW